MSDLSTETKVFEITLHSKFYVLAKSEEDALQYVAERHPLNDLQDVLPTDAESDYRAYKTPNQDDYMRGRCVNGEYTVDE